MDLDCTTRAIATEAWSQLVHSIISNSPPRDMSRDYYYTSAERGFNHLQKRLKRLERYKYKLGTKNIQTRMRYDMLSTQADQHEDQQGIEHVRDCTRSGKHFQVLQENEDEYQQGIEHIRYCLISNKHSEVVQTNEDENVQGIDHIRECIRSSKHSELMRANVAENEQKNDRTPESPRSVLHSEVVQPYEDDCQHGIEHIQYCLVSNKHSEVLQRNEEENQQGIGNIRDCLRSSKHCEVLQANEDEDYQGIEHILEAPRSSKVSEVVQTNKDENQQEIEHIQNSLEFNMHSEQERANEDGMHIEHTRDSIKSTVSFKPTEYDDLQLINHINQTGISTQFSEAWQEPEDVYQEWNNYKEARKMSTLFDELLELIENGNMLREEKPTLRFQVLKVIKLIHHYGVDIIRRGVENELEDVNLKSDEIEEDMGIYYKKKGLEVMLRICDTETCQRTIYDIIGKAERHQVFFI